MMDGVSHFSSRAYFFIKKRRPSSSSRPKERPGQGSAFQCRHPRSLDTSRRVFDTGLPSSVPPTPSQKRRWSDEARHTGTGDFYLLPLKIKGKTMAILLCDGANLPLPTPGPGDSHQHHGAFLDLLPSRRSIRPPSWTSPSAQRRREQPPRFYGFRRRARRDERRADTTP